MDGVQRGLADGSSSNFNSTQAKPPQKVVIVTD
jgi:hypothetical protein